LILISHDLGVVAEAANDVNVMYAGEIVEHADVRNLFHSPAHPYTRALLRTVRDLESPEVHELNPIPGAPPALGKLPPGCPFAPRCPRAEEWCRIEAPLYRSLGGGHRAACHFAEELEAVPA
jgi:oligopeptide/dipeptide ABC transporter ATP-binding protein